MEESEYELEELGQGGGKKNKKPPPRIAELEEIVGRHKEHMGRLEKVLRCIDNETIHPDELENLKTEMEMYLVGATAYPLMQLLCAVEMPRFIMSDTLVCQPVCNYINIKGQQILPKDITGQIRRQTLALFTGRDWPAVLYGIVLLLAGSPA